MGKMISVIPVSELPQTIILGPNRNETKVFAINFTGFSPNSQITAKLSCSFDKVNNFPILRNNGSGGDVQDIVRLDINTNNVNSVIGKIIKNCPVPYLHIDIESTSNTGTITEINYEF